MGAVYRRAQWVEVGRTVECAVSARVIFGEKGVREAAVRLRSGGVVGLPTETVYGLAADATNPAAVAAVFALKGRPASNPLIVHVADVDSARRWARVWPESADRLARRFWPGPLTLVVEQAGGLAPAVLAGGTTVGLRVPEHPVALAVLREAGVPLAAPSANRSESVSPTAAAHVVESLGPWADDLLIVDGGACRVGIESTVVDVSGGTAMVLRPGMITLAQIREVVPEACLVEATGADAGVVRSPGLSHRHYAPRARVELRSAEDLKVFPWLAGDAVLARTVRRADCVSVAPDVRWVQMPEVAAAYAAELYRVFREMDSVGVERLVVELPPGGDAWRAVVDRLRRASAAPTGEAGG